MNFNEPLHPEIVLQKKGKPYLKNLYKKILSNVEIHQKATHKQYELKPGFPEIGGVKDEVMTSHMCLVKLWSQSGQKVYHVPPDFTECLQKIDVKIPVKHLPDNFCAFINFSNSDIDDGDDVVQGAYVYYGSTRNTIMAVRYPDELNRKSIWISYVGYPIGDNEDNPRFGDFKNTVEDGMTVRDIAEQIENHYRRNDYGYVDTDINPDTFDSRVNVYKMIFNTLLYINSYEPVLEHCRPFVKKKGKNGMSLTKLRKAGRSINESSLPITIVNGSYHKELINYTDTTTHVHSYMRWQPCGPQFSMIKLIWVKDHQRNYKKKVEEIE